MKKANKKAAKYLRKAGYLDPDNLEMVNYNNDNNIGNFDDVVTVDYNFDNNLKDLDEIDLKKTSPVKKLAAKKIVKKYRNLARKKPNQKFSSKKKQRDYNDDVVFLKKILVHPRDRLARKTRHEIKFVKQVPVHPRDKLARKMRDEVKFVKQVLVHPRDRLAKKTRDEVKFVKQVPLHPRERLKRKIELENYAHLNKKCKNEDITFIKQVPLHPRERLKRLEKINKKVDLVNEIG